MLNNQKTNDVGDGEENDNEMDFWCQACQTSRMTRKLTMIREGMGHALAVSDTRNGTARNEMEMNMKWGPGQIRAGTFTRGWGGAFVDQDPHPPPPHPSWSPCEATSCTPVLVWVPHTHIHTHAHARSHKLALLHANSTSRSLTHSLAHSLMHSLTHSSAYCQST